MEEQPEGWEEGILGEKEMETVFPISQVSHGLGPRALGGLALLLNVLKKVEIRKWEKNMKNRIRKKTKKILRFFLSDLFYILLPISFY